MDIFTQVPRATSPRRPKQPPLPPPWQPPAASTAPALPAAKPAPLVLRVGDYEVGENYCPHLWGPPDIRY